MKAKLVVVALPALVLLAACGAAGETSGPSTSALHAQPGYTTAGGGSGSASLPLKSSSGTQQSAPTTPDVPPLPSAQHLELSATIGIEVAHDRFEQGLDAILGIIANEHGYLASSHTAAGAGAPRSGTFTFQVPVDNYQDTLNQLRSVGRFTHQDSASKPHDAEYVDLQARLKSAQLQLAAYNALLAKATSIGDIIAIEQQVAQVQQEIEQYQGQLQYLDSLTQYSTVTVDLVEKGAAPAAAPPADQWGFAGSLRAVLHNLAAIANGLILIVGTLLPFLLIAWAAFATRRRWLPVLVRP